MVVVKDELGFAPVLIRADEHEHGDMREHRERLAEALREDDRAGVELCTGDGGRRETPADTVEAPAGLGKVTLT